MALIGGGGGFIGRVHVLAATLDRRADLVAGAFSSDPAKSRGAAEEFGVEPARAYGSYGELLDAECRRPADQRLDFVTIATPNHTHFEIAQAALQAGFHVVCEKPLANDVAQAEALVRAVRQSGCVFAVAHAYSCYPLVDQVRDLIRNGELGELLAVRVHYLQGGLWALTPGQPPARAAWKADPTKAGPSGTLADIGTHAYHLARFATGLEPLAVSCQLRTYHPVRPLDDYAHAVLRFDNGALGTLTASQITHGRLNDLTLEVDGARGSIAWRQEEPNQLLMRRYGEPARIYERNPRAAFLSDSARAGCRLPGGHPEGVLEAFANLYRHCYEDMLARAGGQPSSHEAARYPDVVAGWAGVHFVQQGLASHRAQGAWMSLAPAPPA
jgi:predicted dehydrogenase